MQAGIVFVIESVMQQVKLSNIEAEQSTDLVHFTKTARVGRVGCITESTEGSMNVNVNW